MQTCKAEAEFSRSTAKFEHDLELSRLKAESMDLKNDVADKNKKIRELQTKVKEVEDSAEASISEVH